MRFEAQDFSEECYKELDSLPLTDGVSTVSRYSQGPCTMEKSVIIPGPKTAHPTVNNYFRTVVLTSAEMKCLEKYVVGKLKADIHIKLDLQQFTYKQGQSTDDAIATIMHLVLKHLEDNVSYFENFLLILAMYLTNLST